MSDGDEIPNGAFVVRGGHPPFVRSLVLECDKHKEGYFGISVQSAVDVSVDELARAMPNRFVGFTTVGEVRRMGYDVVRTSGKRFHATLVVPLDWEQTDAEQLALCFQTHDKQNQLD